MKVVLHRGDLNNDEDRALFDRYKRLADGRSVESVGVKMLDKFFRDLHERPPASQKAVLDAISVTESVSRTAYRGGNGNGYSR
jgi:hypothetical protein